MPEFQPSSTKYTIKSERYLARRPLEQLYGISATMGEKSMDLEGSRLMWPQVNVIGVAGYEEDKTVDAQWIEPLPEGVTPEDLYEAQVRRRLKSAR